MNLKELRLGISLYDSLREKVIKLELKHFRELSISETSFKARYLPLIISEGVLLSFGFEKTRESGLIVLYESTTDVNLSILYTASIKSYCVFWSGKPYKGIFYLHQLENIM